MTIQKFAERTGLPPSTLRYYDMKKLLEPSGRSEKGYRIYGEEQVQEALIIHSLRLADIKVEDIQAYLHAGEEEKASRIYGWRQELEEKLASMKIARQYLNSMNSDERHLHLVKWEEETCFIWVTLAVPRTFHPFQKAMIEILAKLKNMEIKMKPGIFVRTLESQGNTITGEVGFILQTGTVIDCPGDMYTERRGPMLFAAVECNVYDPFTCFHFMRQIQRFGFQAQGIKLEKYDTPESRTFSYMVPLAGKH